MIEQLLRRKETVDYPENSNVKLHTNEESSDYPLHWHSAIEIISPIKSHYTVICNDLIYYLEEDEYLFILPGVIHRIEAPSIGSRYILQFDIQNSVVSKEIEQLLNNMPPVVYIKKDDSKHFQKIHKLFQSTVNEYKSDAPFKDTMVLSKLLSMIAYMGRNLATATGMDQKVHNMRNKELEYYRLFLLICEYIQKNHNKVLTLDEVATFAGFSKFHFTKIFRHYAGVTFYQYINKIRIDHAKQLLKDNELTVQEISSQCGFHNLSAFLRMFKIQVGTTPMNYKRNYIDL